MRLPILTFTSSIVLALQLAAGQQPVTPPPTQTQPCTPQALPKPLKDIHPPSRFQQLLDKQRKRIQQQTGIDVPSTDDLKKDAQKSCPPPAAQKPPAAPVPAPPAKPVLVCPPKATLIPDHPYCLLPDRTVVDAIPLPASMTTSQPTPAQPTKH